jgi:hypothetical protein
MMSRNFFVAALAAPPLGRHRSGSRNLKSDLRNLKSSAGWCLLLRRARHVQFARQMRQEPGDLGRAQLARTPPTTLPLRSFGGRGEGRGEVRVIPRRRE